MLLIEGHRAKHPQVGGAIPLGNLQNGREKPVKPLADAWRIGAGCGHGSTLLRSGRTRSQLFCEEAKVTLRLIEQRAGQEAFSFLFQTNPDLILRWLAGLRRVAWPLRERPDPAVMAQLEHGTHALFTASVVLHELSYGIHRLAAWRRQERLNSYLQALLASGLTVLP